MNLNLSQPSFFKEIPLLTQVQGNPHLVHFAAGFSKTVDPLSGMTVNLIWIHQWLLDLKIQFENMNFPDFLAALISYQKFLSEVSSKAFADSSEQVLVPSVQMRFLDGSILRFKPLQTGEEQFVFEKSGATVLTEPVDFTKTVRVAKVFFKIRTTLDLLQAQEFSIPTSYAPNSMTMATSAATPVFLNSAAILGATPNVSPTAPADPDATPPQTATLEEKFLAELQKKTSLPVLRLEMWDPILQVAQVVNSETH